MERFFRSLKNGWVPVADYVSYSDAAHEITDYIVEYYSALRTHVYNGGFQPNEKFGSGKNGFTGGDPQTGELSTALDANFFDAVQEEIARTIEAAGVTLNKSDNNQLLSAIRALIG